MNLFPVVIVLACVLCSSSYTMLALDTTQTRAVVVEDSRIDAAKQATPTYVVDATLMGMLAPASVGSALSLAPGTFIRQFGGVGGMQTASIRGGAAAQSLVLFDGVRLASAQNATVDLSLIPTSMIGSATVVRGSASAMYGANAMSGVVLLTPPSREHTGLVLRGSLGSFEEHRITGTAHTSWKGALVSAAVDVHESRGGYPIDVDEFDHDIVRGNTDAHLASAMLSMKVDNASVFVLGRRSERGIPPPYVQGSASRLERARLNDADLLFGGRFRILASESTIVEAQGGVRVSAQHFVDSDATILGPGGLDLQFDQRDANAALSALHVFDDYLVGTVRAEASWADLRGAMLQPGVGTMVLRRSLAASADVRWSAWYNTNVHAALRADVFSDAGFAVSPLVTISHEFGAHVTARASWSFGFRPPTFNELYYLNYGTSDLLPERASTVQTGVVVKVFPTVIASADAFVVNTTNLILGVPVSPVATSARNVGKASTVGAEMGIRAGLLDNRLLLSWSYSLLDSRDRTERAGIDGTLLPYAPQELIAGIASWNEASWFALVQWNYASHRFAQPGEEYSSVLPALSVVGASVGLRGNGALFGADVRLQCDNLFDLRYSIIRGFPMPGRIIRLLVDIQWNSPQ